MNRRSDTVLRFTAPMRALVHRFAFLFLIAAAFGIMLLGKAETLVVERLRATAIDVVAPIMDGLSRPIATVSSGVERVVNFFDVYEEKITGHEGEYYNRLKKQLANMHYLVGRFSYSRENYADAYTQWTKALQYDSSHRYSTEGLTELTKLAEKLYFQGYATRHLDPKAARERWELVMRIVPRDNEFYEKARDRLAE